MSKVTPFIWFKDQAEEAMEYYVSVFPNAKIIDIERYAGDQGIPGEQELKGKVLTGIFEIMGQQFMCLDGGPQFELTGAISFLAEFDEQKELDAVWEKLMDGGRPMQCGWIADKFGVTWQITPTSLGRMMSDPSATAEQKKALMQAMMPMVKLETAKLEAAFEKAKR
ncbi:MAG TPA: VOC family protein [Candidatus Saccharimonadales bacterium]|nr:VOC family protein [Candidatus Saccharimonadales bacterium]